VVSKPVGNGYHATNVYTNPENHCCQYESVVPAEREVSKPNIYSEGAEAKGDNEEDGSRYDHSGRDKLVSMTRRQDFALRRG